MIETMKAIDEALPKECKNHGTTIRCTDCHRAFKVAAMLASNANAQLSLSDAIEASLDFVSAEFTCPASKQIGEEMTARRIVKIEPVDA